MSGGVGVGSMRDWIVEPPLDDRHDTKDLVRWLCRTVTKMNGNIIAVNARLDHITEQLKLKPFNDLEDSIQRPHLVRTFEDSSESGFVFTTDRDHIPHNSQRSNDKQMPDSVTELKQRFTAPATGPKGHSDPIQVTVAPRQHTRQSPAENFDSCSTYQPGKSSSPSANVTRPNGRVNSERLAELSPVEQLDTQETNVDVDEENGAARPGYVTSNESGYHDTDGSNSMKTQVQQQKYVPNMENERDFRDKGQREKLLTARPPSPNTERKHTFNSLESSTSSNGGTAYYGQQKAYDVSAGSEYKNKAERAKPINEKKHSRNEENPMLNGEVEQHTGGSAGNTAERPAHRPALNFQVDLRYSRKRPLGLPLTLQGPKTYSCSRLKRVLRKTRTMSTEDNRPNLLRNTYRIDEDDAEETSGTIFRNNQELPPSGLKNEHGDQDNRFDAEAHDEGRIKRANRGHGALSNSSLIRNGLKKNSRETVEDRRGSPERRTDTSDQSEAAVTAPKVGIVTDDFLKTVIQRESDSAAACDEAKSLGVDTVICLDVSESMKGKPLQMAKQAVHQLLDGFESNAIEYDLEENIAMVTFGKETKIVQHLTNDFEKIKLELDNLEAGGPSPLWLGLALSLTELEKRGGACSVGKLNVKPRIILITDGNVSSKYNLGGREDRTASQKGYDEVKVLLSSPVKQSVYSIDCLVVGPYVKDVLMTVSNNRIFEADSIEYLVQFFRIQDSANVLIEKILKGELQPDQLSSAVEDIGLHPLAKTELFAVLAESLPSMKEPEPRRVVGAAVNLDGPQSLEQQLTDSTAVAAGHAAEGTGSSRSGSDPNSLEAQPGSLDGEHDRSTLDSVNDDVDDVEGPNFGAGVLPHKDWIGYHTRQNVVGTVIGLRKKGLVKVLWSDATVDKCKYGVAGQYDIQLAQESDIDRSTVRIGALVERGPDWRWQDQDGGLGNTGVVMKVEKSIIHVIWPHGGQGNYRYGYNKKFDIKLHVPVQKQEDEDETVKKPYWQVFDPDHVWRSFPPEINQSTEEMFQKSPKHHFLVKIQGRSCKIILQEMQLCDLQTQKYYDMRRIEMTKKEMRDNHPEAESEQ